MPDLDDPQTTAELQDAEETLLDPIDPSPEGEGAQQVAAARDPETGRFIPMERFNEVTARAQRAESERAHLMQMVSLQQEQLAMVQAQLGQVTQAQRTPEEQVDPELEGLFAPIARKVTRQYQEKLDRLERQNAVLVARHEAEASWQYLKKNVPDFDEIEGDVARKLGTMPDAVVRDILRNPDSMILVSQLVKAERGADQAAGRSVAHDVSRSRARSEAGGQVSAPTALNAAFTTIDWSTASEDFVRKWHKMRGLKLPSEI